MQKEAITLTALQQQIERLEARLNSTKEVLNLNDVAAYTGYSKSYLYKLTMSGAIPCYRPNGKALFFGKKELDEWLLSNPKKQQQELANEAATYAATHGKGGLQSC